MIQPDIPTNTKEKLYNGLVAGSQVTTQVVQSLLKLHVTLLYTLHGWFAYRVLLNQCAHCRFLFLAPFYNSPDGWVGITYQVEELVIPSLADVVCPGATIYVTSCMLQMAGGNIGEVRRITIRRPCPGTMARWWLPLT